MKTLVGLALSAVLVTSSAFAGGPVVVVEEPAPVVEEGPASSTGILPWLMVPLLLCVFMCGSDEEATPVPQ
jgi:hypothetical protein